MRPWVSSLASLAWLVGLALPALAAPCQLVAQAPRTVPWPAALAAFHPRRADANDPRAPLVLTDGDDHLRVAEPPALAAAFALASSPRQLRTTSRHVIVLDERGGLSAGPRGGKLVAVHGGRVGVFDAVDGGDGESWIAGAQGGRIFVGHLDKKGQLAIDSVLPATPAVTQLGLLRTGGGFLVAWIGWPGGPDRSERGPSWLSIAWLDGHGVAAGAALQLDVADDEQAMANLAVAHDGEGVVVAWNPIVGSPGAHELVPVELRAFRLLRDQPPLLVRRLALHSQAWVVAGSAGGVLANDLQAVSANGQALLAWLDFGMPEGESGARHDEPVLRAALADGGEPIGLGSRRLVAAFLRAQPAGAVVTLLDDARRVQTVALTVGAEGCAAAAATAWTPPASDAGQARAAVATPPTRAECERLTTHVLTLAAADAKGKAQVTQLRAQRRAIVEQCQIEMSRPVYECVQQASTFAAADGCQ